MAAATDKGSCASATRSDFGWPETRPSLATTSPQWDELDLQIQLGLIARLWILTAPTLLTEKPSCSGRRFRRHVTFNPLVLPDPTPKRSRKLLKPCDDIPPPLEVLADPSRADETARQRDCLDAVNGCLPPLPNDSQRCRKRQKDSLLDDSTTQSYLDLWSEEGFVQHAKKKKSKQQPLSLRELQSNSGNTQGGGGDDRDGDQNGNDGKTGGDAGGDGNNNGDDKDKDKKKANEEKEKQRAEEKEREEKEREAKEREAKEREEKEKEEKEREREEKEREEKEKEEKEKEEREREREREKQRKKESIGGSRVEDLRAAFETGGKKKKKTKAQVDEKIEEEKIEPSKVENAKKFDTFDDIQVNDNAPSISVNAGGSSPESKPNLFGIFTSWMGGREGNRSKDNMPKEKEQKKDLLEVNPWESDQSKSRKNDQGSHISALDIDDAKREESAVRPEKEEDNLGLGFTATSKDKKKKKKKDELLPVTTSETHTPEAVNEPVATKDNVWADSLTSGSKKSKKGVLEAKESLDNNKVEKQSRLSPEPEKTENIVGSTTTSKKDKEKKGKVSVTEAEANERQAVAKAPEVETDTIDDLGKKKKKKKSKNAEHELETEPDFEADTAIPAEIDNADEGWSSSWNTTTVKKKGKKSKGTEEMNPEAEADVPMEPEKKGEVASIWGIAKKDKKKKGVVEETKLPAPPAPDPDPPVLSESAEAEVDDLFISTSTKKKKNKKDAIAKESEHEGPDPGHKTEPVQEPDPESKTTDGKKDRKKKKKGIVEGPPKVLNPLSDPDLEREESLEGGRANASASSKEKKRKKNSILEQVALKESQAGSVSETSAHNDDDYLSIGSKDDKKHNSPDATEGFLERKQLGLSPPKLSSQESTSAAWGFWGATKNITKKFKEEPQPAEVEEGWLPWQKRKTRTSTELKDSDKQEFSPAGSKAPGAGEDDFWGNLSSGSANQTEGNLMPDSIEEPKNDDRRGLSCNSKKDKKKGNKNFLVEVENGSYVNGTKPDSVEESRDHKDDELDWNWADIEKAKKSSLPSAPMPPSINLSLDGQEPEEDIWGNTKEEEDDKAAADALAAEIAQEEEERAVLLKKNKLKRSEKVRLAELNDKYERRLEENAAKEAAEAAQREAERAEAEALEAQEKAAAEAQEAEAREAEQKAAAEELAREIAGEEKELHALARKVKKKKLSKSDQKRFNELTNKAQARADEQAAKEIEEQDAAAEDQAAQEAEEQVDMEVDDQAADEAEEAPQEATAEEEAASDVDEQAVRDEEEAKREREEAEAAAAKKSKKSLKSEEKKSKKERKEEEKKEKREREREREREKEREKEKEKEKKKKKGKEKERGKEKEKQAEERKEEEGEEEEEGEDENQEELKEKKETHDDDELDLDNMDLAPELVDEILSGYSPPEPQRKKAQGFSFWNTRAKSPVPEPVVEEPVVEEPVVEEPVVEDPVVEDAPSSSKAITDDDRMKPKKTKTKVKSSKLAERLKKFEPAHEEDDDINLMNALAPPPPPPPAPIEDDDDKYESSKEMLPGAFPDDNQDEIIGIVDIAPVEKKKKKSSKRNKGKAAEVPPPPPEVPMPPPPPPEAPVPPAAVLEEPITPPPETKSSRKDRPRINRDGSGSWGVWSATPHREEKRPKLRSEEKSHRREREGKSSSSKGSSSDRDRIDERRERKSALAPKPRKESVFQSTPPISRSMSTREKRHSTNRTSSRRYSVDMENGLASPPPEEAPTMSSKAAKVLGVDKSRSRKSSARPSNDEDFMMHTAVDSPPSPEKSSRKRSKAKIEHDDMDMMDGEYPPSLTPLKRSNSGAKKGLAGLFGGLKSAPRPEVRPEVRPEPRRRNTYYTTDDEFKPDKRAKRASRDYHGMDTEIVDEDREARRAARRARRAEEKAAEEAHFAREEARRERHRRREEEEAEARRQAERETRRAERRAAKEREAEQRAIEAKEAERAERRRLRKLEKEAEEAEAEARRAARGDRRRSRYIDPPEDEEERRRRRHEARRAEERPERPDRRRSMPADNYVYPPERSSRYAVDEQRVDGHRRTKTTAWPHSGTDSWVKEHSDAGPPPHDGRIHEAPPPPEDDEEARRAARRARRRAKYGDVDADMEEDRRRRHARREERDRRERREEKDRKDRGDRRVGGSDGSGGGPRESFFTDTTPRSSWWRKLTGGA